MMRRLLMILGLLGVFALAPATARADDILEEGEGYFVMAMYPNAGGTVVVEIDYSHSPDYIVTTILDVEPAPGWTYKITSAGGVDTPIDIRYESAEYKSRFRMLYKPGKTVIDYGEIKEK